MKHYLSSMMMVLAVVGFVAGCGKSKNDQDASNLQGTWNMRSERGAHDGGNCVLKQLKIDESNHFTLTTTTYATAYCADQKLETLTTAGAVQVHINEKTGIDNQLVLYYGPEVTMTKHTYGEVNSLNSQLDTLKDTLRYNLAREMDREDPNLVGTMKNYGTNTHPRSDELVQPLPTDPDQRQQRDRQVQQLKIDKSAMDTVKPFSIDVEKNLNLDALRAMGLGHMTEVDTAGTMSYRLDGKSLMLNGQHFERY